MVWNWNVFKIACHLSSAVARFEGEFEEDNICNLALSFYERYLQNAQEEGAKWTDEVEASLPQHAKRVILTLRESEEVILFAYSEKLYNFVYPMNLI